MNIVATVQDIDAILKSEGINNYMIAYVNRDVKEGDNLVSNHQALHFLISENLPEGLEVISETHALKVGPTQPTKLHMFYGQMLIRVPVGAGITDLDFVRVVPKTAAFA